MPTLHSDLYSSRNDLRERCSDATLRVLALNGRKQRREGLRRYIDQVDALFIGPKATEAKGKAANIRALFQQRMRPGAPPVL